MGKERLVKQCLWLGNRREWVEFRTNREGADHIGSGKQESAANEEANWLSMDVVVTDANDCTIPKQRNI
jgi:hypothetical protein